MAIPRMRTIEEAHSHILSKDKDSKISRYFLREICKQGKVHNIRLGNKILLNIDDLEEILSSNINI